MPQLMRDLFEVGPQQWGLRGDVWLWQAMKDLYADVPVVGDVAEVEALIKETFLALTGVDVDDPAAPESVFREELAHGGMSSGYVSVSTWRDRLIPLLASRVGLP